MKKYLLEITETSQKQITVSANSSEESEKKIRERYWNKQWFSYHKNKNVRCGEISIYIEDVDKLK